MNDRAEFGGWTHQDRNGIYIKPFDGWVHTEVDEYVYDRYTVCRRQLITPSDWAVWSGTDEWPVAHGFTSSADARAWVEGQCRR